jgi:hypothetical protein
MPPLALTDAQLETVYRCAAPLAPAVRPAFLELVAQTLARAGEIGDGTVGRACAEAERKFWDPTSRSGVREVRLSRAWPVACSSSPSAFRASASALAARLSRTTEPLPSACSCFPSDGRVGGELRSAVSRARRRSEILLLLGSFAGTPSMKSDAINARPSSPLETADAEDLLTGDLDARPLTQCAAGQCSATAVFRRLRMLGDTRARSSS